MRVDSPQDYLKIILGSPDVSSVVRWGPQWGPKVLGGFGGMAPYENVLKYPAIWAISEAHKCSFYIWKYWVFSHRNKEKSLKKQKFSDIKFIHYCIFVYFYSVSIISTF
jgi:hypothetical protein